MAAGMLICAAPAWSDGTAAPAFAPLAHSALVTVEGASGDRTLLLRVRRTSDSQPLAGAELTVTVDGTSAVATARTDGTWAVPIPALAPGSPGRLAIVVTHDGVREVLDAQLPAAEGAGSGSGTRPASGGMLGRLSAFLHKQMSWWVLNILIVLVGVVAFSRRKP